MKILKNLQYRHVYSALALLAALVLPLVAGSTEHRLASGSGTVIKPQSPAEAPLLKPSSLAADKQFSQVTSPPISDPARLFAITDAPSARKVGLDEHLGVRIPLDLTFHDEEGKPVRLRDLITRPTVIAPVYYRCPNVCHFLQGELAQVLPQLNLVAGSDYQVLSISFDDSETPELARRTRDTYLAATGGKIPTGGWRFLTGEKPAIMALTDAVGFHFLWAEGAFQHPVTIIVVSPDGTIIRYLQGTRILPKDLTLALYEAKEGQVGSSISKMVQYCFSYDPKGKTYVFNLLRVSATVILATLGVFLVFLLLTGKKKTKDRHS